MASLNYKDPDTGEWKELEIATASDIKDIVLSDDDVHLINYDGDQIGSGISIDDLTQAVADSGNEVGGVVEFIEEEDDE